MEVEKEIEDASTNTENLLVMVAIVIACVADAFTVYILRRFKKLLKHHQNIYIFHMSVLNLINFPFTVLAHLGFNYEFTRKTQHVVWWKWEYLFLDIMTSFIFAQFSLMTIMTIDWYMVTFAPQKSTIFRKFTTSVIVSAYLYVITVSLYSSLVFLWHGYPGFLSIFFALGNIVLSFILYLVFGVIYLRRRKNLPRPNAVALKISVTKIVVIWLFIITTLFNEAIPDTTNVLRILDTFFLLSMIWFPAAQLILLYFWDPNYKALLSRTFCCRTITSTGTVERLDESVEEERAVVYSANNDESRDQEVN